MTRTRDSSTLPTGARHGRHEEERWRAPYRRARRELISVFRRLARTGRAVEAAERFLATGSIDTWKQARILSAFPPVRGWLSNSVRRLAKAIAALEQTHHRAMEAPALADALTPLMFSGIAACFDLGALTVLLSEHAEALGPIFYAAVALRALNVARPRPIAAAKIIVPLRHRRVLGNIPASARRVSRGRAPPSSFFPSL